VTSAIVRIARSQAIVARNFLRGWPIVYTGPTSMTIDDDDLELAAELLRDRSLWADRSPITAFEQAFADWNGSRHALTFVSGRVALAAVLQALGLGAGDEVVVPGYTCVVVANALRNAGLEPVYADIELETYGLDAAALANALTPRTRAVVVHHLFGLVSRDLAAAVDIARSRGLFIIEDCAQAAGATFAGRRVGNFGDVGIFSADPSKPFTCVQGGLAVTNDDSVFGRLASIQRAMGVHDDETTAGRLRNLSLNYTLNKDPQRWWSADLAWARRGHEYFFGIPSAEVEGGAPADAGCRMSPPLARIALNQLRKLDHYNRRRRANADRWSEWCAANGFTPPVVVPESTPTFLRYPVLVRPEMKRDLRWAYRSLGVVPGVWFTSHLHPAPIRLDHLPNATAAVDRCINFPTLYFEDRWHPLAQRGG
jgi:dTDP-4-amino-4,6-dideoxygalactose transaminase